MARKKPSLTVRTVQFDDEEPLAVSRETWIGIYRRLQNMNPTNSGERRIALTSKTPTHDTPERMVDRTFTVNDQMMRNTKIALGNLERRTRRS